METNNQTHSHKARSPSPVAGSSGHSKLGKLLGNLCRVHEQYPELLSRKHSLPLEGSTKPQPTPDRMPQETVKQDAPPLTNHTVNLSLSHWESSPATQARPHPRLGRLDKLEELGLFTTGSSSNKASHHKYSSNSIFRASGGLKASLQDPLHISSCPPRLQRAYGLLLHKPAGRDSSSTIVESESPLDADDGSANDLGSRATTPATSPDFTHEVQAKIDAIVNNTALDGTRQGTIVPSSNVKVIVPAWLWSGANPDHTPQGPIPQYTQLPLSLSSAGPLSIIAHFQEKAQQYRSNIAARIATNFAVLRPCETLTLPWDEHGNYTVIGYLDHQKVGISYGNKSSFIIEPHYRVDKATQLSIVKARLAQTDFEHQLKHPISTTTQDVTPVMVVNHPLVDKMTHPVHVFVDMSNIVIGFYDCMRHERNLPPQQRIQASFFFEALATILERERPCAKRIVAGSMGPGAPWEDHMFEAQSCGYTMHILQRVKGPKPSKTITRTSPSMLSPGNGWNVHHEQGVDELLQLHMLQSIVDTPPLFGEFGEPLSPGTMVLATGDGAEAEFSDGFFNHVRRALKHGWRVEVVGFQHNMNQVWDEQAIPDEWRAQFRLIFLDDFAEELLASFR